MKSTLSKMDKALFVFMLLYSVLGLIMIFSASSITAVLYNRVEESYFFKKQFIFVVLMWAIGLGFIIKFPTSKYKKLAPLGMVLITAALFLLIPYGKVTNSARSWYNLGFFSFQPSEFVKSIMIVFLAVYFERIIGEKDYKISKIMFPFIIILILLLKMRFFNSLKLKQGNYIKFIYRYLLKEKLFDFKLFRPILIMFKNNLIRYLIYFSL